MKITLNTIVCLLLSLFFNNSINAQTKGVQIISGQVIDSLTKQPLKNVRVVFTGTWKGKKGNYAKYKSKTTDKNGNFKTKLTRKYNWTLFAVCDDYKEYKINTLDLSNKSWLYIMLIKK